MKAHLIQMDIEWEDREANFAIADRLIEQASPDPGDLVVLPEMFDSGFSFNVARTADTKGETARWIQTKARAAGIVIQGSRTVWEGSGHLAQNLAHVAGPDGFICEYKKIHPFGFGGESKEFEGGNEVVTYDCHAEDTCLKVCPAICYDLRFPELFRIGLAKGAEVFALGASWPTTRAAHWRALLLARAIENQAYVLGVNRCGSDPALQYDGGTIAIGPKGEVLGEIGGNEGVLTVELSKESVENWRSDFPAWTDVRL